MNYKNIFLILLVLVTVSTLCILISKPKMHKVVMVYNSDYIVTPNETVEIEEKTIPTIEQKPEVTVSKAKVETAVEKKVTAPAKTTQTKQTKTTTAKPTVQKEVKKAPQPVAKKQEVVKAQPKQEVKKVVTPEVQKVQTVQTKPVEKKVEKKVEPIQTQTQPKVLTAQEEEIAWNIWRSNLQNQIMKDVRLPIIPNGIIFKFTFDVDKFGRVSNVQTWSTTPSYTPYAVQYIAPVIRSYQGRNILNFPTGSNRTTTKVTGGWRISTSTKYSTPNDYNDTEKVVK